MSSIIEFAKKWMLPIAMGIGIVSYLIYHNLPVLYPIGPYVHEFAVRIQPVLIFVMLFLQFNKVSPHDLKLEWWHLWLLLIQGGLFIGMVFIASAIVNTDARILLETGLLCFITPTAIAAGVITEKLGGSLSGIMTYLVLVNLLVSVLIPTFIPILHPVEGSTFSGSFFLILRKVFPMLILPCVAAWTVRYTMRKVQIFFMRYVDLAFYLWGFSLIISLALTTRSIIISGISFALAAGVGIVSLAACILQFRIGRRIGKHYSYSTSVTAGQALGQKNTVFEIWLGYTYMSPAASLAGGFYCIWHNLINSWELAHSPKQKK